MSFSACQQHLDVLYYPCLVLLCRRPVNGSREVSKTLATEWDPQLPTSTAETCRACCGSLVSPTEGIIWPTRGARTSWNVKHLNISRCHTGWLPLALGAVDPRISLAVPRALPMEKHCWGQPAAQMRCRIFTWARSWTSTARSQGSPASLSTQLCTEKAWENSSYSWSPLLQGF